MKLTDYVIEFLAEKGVRHVFGLTGGAIVHFFDSADRGGRIKPVFNHHEQAGAFAAQSYAKITGSPGACFVTTGPGATNAVTGLAAAWLDSVPCFYISGQTRLAHTTHGKKIRQLGTQNLDIISVVKSLTKYAVMLERSEDIRYHLERAFFEATRGRPGPVWLDVPLDLQWADIEPSQLRGFTSPPEEMTNPPVSPGDLAKFAELLQGARRPLVLAGYGIRLGGAEEEFRRFVRQFDIPYVTSWGVADLMPTGDPLCVGRPGVSGQRGANLAVQNCDLLICLGSHLCIPITGTMFDAFAREARIVMVDVDRDEIEDRTIPVALPIQADVKRFLGQVLAGASPGARPERKAWSELIGRYRKHNEPPKQDPGAKSFGPYQFVAELTRQSEEGDIVVVDGGGTNVYVSFQTWEIKEKQRLLLSTALCSMGSGLPEAIGACFAGGKRRTICLCGDGSLQLNIQELQTIKDHGLPIKIFVTNNSGYVSIRLTQKEFLAGNLAGSSAEGGMSLPDYRKVAEAYGLKTFRIDSSAQLASGIQAALAYDGPCLCEVVVSPEQEIIPRQAFMKKDDGTFSPRPLEDMAPLLERSEFEELMVVAPWKPPGSKPR